MKRFELRTIISLALFCGLGLVGMDFSEATNEVQITEIDAKTQKKAENFVQNLGNIAIGIINKSKISTEEVQNEFNKLLNESFALESIARYSLGKNYRLLSDEEKKDFQQCFRNMLVRIYSSRFSEYKTAKLVVTGSRKKSAKQVLVNSKIIIPNKEDVSVTWSIYLSKGSLKVYDVVISDVSVSNIQRSEFMGKISETSLERFLVDFKEKYKQ